MSRGTGPFNIIHTDVVHMEIAYNQARYFSHFYDPFSDYHLAYPITNKRGETLQSLTNGVIAWAGKKGYNVQQVHSDGDTGLAADDHNKQLQTKGIRFT